MKLINPEPDENEESICLYNLKMADKHHNLSSFVSASMGWFKLNPTKNYQDLELFFRKNNFDSHLYAIKPRVPDSILGINGKTNNKYIYECIFSCRPKKYALKEVLEYWPNYKENLHQLKFAGSIILNEKGEEKIKEIPNTGKIDDMQIDTYNLISLNLKKIIFENLSINEYLENLNTSCVNKFGKNLVKKVVATNKYGGNIYGLYVDDKLISDIGLSVRIVNSNEIVDLIKIC